MAVDYDGRNSRRACAGISSQRQDEVDQPVATALRIMPSYSASACAKVRPPCSLMARRPSVPSLPVPDRMMQAAFSALVLGERDEESRRSACGGRAARRLGKLQSLVEERQAALGGMT